MKEIVGHLYKRDYLGGKPRYIKKDSDIPGTFYVDYMIDGKRIRKCLKTEDLKEAQERWARDKINLMSVSDEEQYLRKLVEEGERAKAKLYQISFGGETVLVKDAFDKYVSGHRRKTGTKEKTLKGYRQQFDRFARWAPLTIKTMRDLVPAHCDLYIHDLEADGMNAETVNKHISLLKLIWKTVDHTWPNPWSGLHTTKEHAQKHYRKFTYAECKAIYAGAKDPEYKGLIILGYSTGQRLGDLATLKWSQVDMKASTIVFTPAKTDKRKAQTIIMPMTEQLHGFLSKLPHDEKYVLGRLGIQYHTSPVNISRIIKRLLKKLKIEETKDGVPSFHSFRHTFASMLANAEAPIQVQTHMTSHTTPGISEIYTHIDAKVLRKWVTKAVKPL